MAKLTKAQQQISFYPEEGTAFCDKTKSQKLFVIESQDNVAVVNNVEDGFVAVHSLDDGYDDYPNWLDSVKSGTIEVVWCPVMKRVSNNKDYLNHWKLT